MLQKGSKVQDLLRIILKILWVTNISNTLHLLIERGEQNFVISGHYVPLQRPMAAHALCLEQFSIQSSQTPFSLVGTILI